jgi:hypothetical protein
MCQVLFTAVAKRNHLREKGLILAHGLRGFVHRGGEGLVEQGSLHHSGQEAERKRE